MYPLGRRSDVLRSCSGLGSYRGAKGFGGAGAACKDATEGCREPSANEFD